MRLDETEIRKRLIRLRNLEYLHTKAKERIARQDEEIKLLKLRIKELEDGDRDKDQKIKAMSFQLEQIKNKLFGKKPTVNLAVQKREKKERNISSYRRPIPANVTETRRHPVNECGRCHGTLKNRPTKIFYEEDIPLPIQKIVIKHEVEVGYCGVCKRQSSVYPVPPKKVTLGDNVKKYICLLSIVSRSSHTQIQDNLKDLFALNVSIGEIGNILLEEADNLRPEYQTLKESVVSQKATHYDETGWKVQKEEQGKYAWVATGTENNDTVFALGLSRGKRNIEDIGVGKIGISDDYGAYRNSFKKHQLCWAHPHRKLRDLAESGEIPREKKEGCQDSYSRFSKLYKAIQKSLGKDMPMYLKRRFMTVFDQISKISNLDPAPLIKIKESLRKNKEKYFTFLKHPGIPIDNNKAERSLRHLVIKRRVSFGSKTQKGAETTSILASVILSLRWNDPQNWFPKYLAIKP